MLQNAPISRISPVVVKFISGKSRPVKREQAAVLTSNHQVLGAVVTLGENEPRLDQNDLTGVVRVFENREHKLKQTRRTLSSANSLPDVFRSDGFDVKALTSCLCRVWSFDEDMTKVEVE